MFMVAGIYFMVVIAVYFYRPVTQYPLEDGSVAAF